MVVQGINRIRYKQDILITNGSQQALDLLGKIFLTKNDGILIENPGYLGALQAFRLYQAKFLPIAIHEQGLDLNELQQILSKNNPKLIYTVPNFQNPTGISYSEENRQAVAKQIAKTDFPAASERDPRRANSLACSLDNEKAFRYYKVEVANVKKLPGWHDGKGKPAWVFVDEVFLN